MFHASCAYNLRVILFCCGGLFATLMLLNYCYFCMWKELYGLCVCLRVHVFFYVNVYSGVAKGEPGRACARSTPKK